jgi:hypothetical protein
MMKGDMNEASNRYWSSWNENQATGRTSDFHAEYRALHRRTAEEFVQDDDWLYNAPAQEAEEPEND